MSATAERAWAGEVINMLLTSQTGNLPGYGYSGGEFFGYPPPFPSDVLVIVGEMTTNATLAQYTNYFRSFAPPFQPDPFDLMYWDPSDPQQNWNALPLGRIAIGSGLVQFRSDWSANAIVGDFHSQDYTQCDHQTEWAGHLEIVKGPDGLLVNPMGVTGGVYPCAANALFLDDLGEGTQDRRNCPSFEASRQPPGVRMTTFENQSGYSYGYSDYKAAYQKFEWGIGNVAGSGKELNREVIYNRGDGMVFVYDRVTAMDFNGNVRADYGKTQHWSHLTTPTLSGNSWAVTQGASGLIAHVFASAPLTLNIVQANYGGPNVPRVEVAFTTPQGSERYVTTLQVGAAADSPKPASRVVSTDGRVEGAAAGTTLAMFPVAAASPPMDLATPLSYLAPDGLTRHYVTGLVPLAFYDVKADLGGGVVYNQTVEASVNGVITFIPTAS
jgi:hypothetical protein